jgi:hypothetical protein
VDVELTVDESSALRHALDSYLSDLRMEIADTDNVAFKRDLRDERAALESVAAKLASAAERGAVRDDQGRTVVRFAAIWVE